LKKPVFKANSISEIQLLCAVVFFDDSLRASNLLDSTPLLDTDDDLLFSDILLLYKVYFIKCDNKRQENF
jgi:hypothetical protein